MVTNNSGRFERGNPGGPGRPRRQTEREYLVMLTEACSPEDWREIVELAVKQARNGQERAREWLAAYLLGKPAHEAGTLHELAVDEAMGIDPVASEAETRQRQAAEMRALFG